MSTTLASRVAGGGITKRSSGARLRVDRDGDLDMDAPAGGRGRGRGNRGNRGGRARRGGRGMNSSDAPTGPGAVRNSKAGSGSGSGALRARHTSNRDPIGTRSRGITRSSGSKRKDLSGSGPVVGVKVHGWMNSQASSEDCIRFLQRKTNLKFQKTQKHGEYLIVYVPASDLQAVLDWNNAKFAGVNLTITADVITELFNETMENATPQNSDTSETIKVLEEVLWMRYNPETKMLDLSKLGEDPLLRQNGFFELNSTTSKMFPALMAVADKKFDTAQQKRDAIHSVSLAFNNLKTVTQVTTLSVTFPDLKNLSLEGNTIDLKGLDGWKSRFKALEQLLLVGNPVTETPGYREEMIRRYQKLVLLDNELVNRPQIQVGDQEGGSGGTVQKPSTALDANGHPLLPLSTKGSLLVDANGVAMQFLSTFFGQIDNNKHAVIDQFYTNESKFSISVNTSAPRVESMQAERQYWDGYIPKSRNMNRLRGDATVFERLAQGPVHIFDLWDALPSTHHNLDNQELWAFDIFPVEVSPGVTGLLAMVHSEFEEMNSAMNSGSGGIIKRSFDRSFTLWLDGTVGVKVMSDMLVVRSYAGPAAWKIDPATTVAAPQPAQPAPANIVQQTPIDVEEKKRKCQMLGEKTGLNMKYAEMCLADTDWDLAKAWEAFMWAKDTLGPEAFAK